MKSICLISGSSPEFLGGISLYQRNLIKYAKEKKLDLDFTWIYPGRENKEYESEGIYCIEIKSLKYPFLKEFDFARKVKNIISKKYFDIINTHANWGYCLKGYKKKENQKIIHTYHGASYPYFKIQFQQFGFLKFLFYPILSFIYFLEKPPIKKADKIICVSNKVKNQIENLYGKKRNIDIIRTGVDLKQFKRLNRKLSRKKLSLDDKNIYGLYSGRGGYWNKGLDRAINLSREIYKINKNYQLIVVGANKDKCNKYLKEDFVLYRGVVDRKDLPKYYSACDFFFSLSRYEGGAPTLVVGEAMASRCFIIFSKDVQQEIIKNGREGLIIDSFGEKSAGKILNILKSKKEISKIKKSAKEKINGLSLNKWGEKYFKVLLR